MNVFIRTSVSIKVLWKEGLRWDHRGVRFRVSNKQTTYIRNELCTQRREETRVDANTEWRTWSDLRIDKCFDKTRKIQTIDKSVKFYLIQHSTKNVYLPNYNTTNSDNNKKYVSVNKYCLKWLIMQNKFVKTRALRNTKLLIILYINTSQ